MKPKLVALILSFGLLTFVPSFAAEQVEEVWRSHYGAPRAIALDTASGSVWVAAGGSVVHLAGDGALLSQTDGFSYVNSVSVNTADASCWVTCTIHPRCR